MLNPLFSLPSLPTLPGCEITQTRWWTHGRGTSPVAFTFKLEFSCLFVFVLKLCQEAFSCYSCVLSWFFPEYGRTTRCKTKQPKKISPYLYASTVYICRKRKMPVKSSKGLTHWVLFLWSSLGAERGMTPVKSLAELPKKKNKKKTHKDSTTHTKIKQTNKP